MKADGSRLIPRKHTETLVLLNVLQTNAKFVPSQIDPLFIQPKLRR